MSTSSPLPWSDAGWLQRPLQMWPMRTIVQSPAGTFQSSVPSAARWAVMSRTSPFGTTWSVCAGVVSSAHSWRTANVLAARLESIARASGRAASNLRAMGLFENVRRMARAVTGAGKVWKRSPWFPTPERAIGMRNDSRRVNDVPSADVSTWTTASPLQACP